MSQGSEPRAAGIGARVMRGGSILAAGTVVERLARLGRNMLLARVVAPDQFGLMAIVLAVIALFEALTEVGVSQAVIQNPKGDTPEFLNVAWWFGVVRGVCVAGAGLLLAPLIASFYGLPELGPVLSFALLSMVFVGLTSPRVYALQREFRFGATLWTTQGAGLLGTVFTLVFAYFEPNVWALVWGAVFEAFVRFALSFVVCPIRLSIRLERAARSELFRFTRGMAGLPMLTFILMQADTFVLGKVISAEALGLYAMAIALAAFPLTVFGKVVQPLVVPVLSRYQNDPGGMRRTVLQASRLIWLLGLPMATVMACFSEPLLLLVYGRPEFAQAAPAFSVYATFVVVYMASMVTFSVHLAIGRPEFQRRVTLVRAAVVLLAIYPLAVAFGGVGAASTLLIAMVCAMAVQLVNLRRVIGLKVRAYLATPLAGVCVAAMAAAPSLLVMFFLELSPWGNVAVAGAIGALAWSGSIVRERRSIRQLRGSARASE